MKPLALRMKEIKACWSDAPTFFVDSVTGPDGGPFTTVRTGRHWGKVVLWWGTGGRTTRRRGES